MSESEQAGGDASIRSRQPSLAPATLCELEERGFVLVRAFADAEQSRALRAMYDDDRRFRKRIVMERHAYGSGEYKYFAQPLPEAVASVRENLYAQLVPIANRWSAALGSQVRFPATHREFLHACLTADQYRPTALLLRYRAGDFNCLHQDLYGPVAFPLQATLYLSQPHDEFEGGAVVLTEQRARAQARVHVLEPQRGDLLLFPSHRVPRAGARPTARASFKHGVAEIERGERFALGIIFHDAL